MTCPQYVCNPCRRVYRQGNPGIPCPICGGPLERVDLSPFREPHAFDHHVTLVRMRQIARALETNAACAPAPDPRDSILDPDLLPEFLELFHALDTWLAQQPIR